MVKKIFLSNTANSDHDKFLRRITKSIYEDDSAKNILNQVKLLEAYLEPISDTDLDREILLGCMRSLVYKLLRALLREVKQGCSVTIDEVAVQLKPISLIIFCPEGRKKYNAFFAHPKLQTLTPSAQ